MDKARARKLEARKRRLESLSNVGAGDQGEAAIESVKRKPGRPRKSEPTGNEKESA